MRSALSIRFRLHSFQQKTDRPKSVVAGNHCRPFIFHPTVVKILAAVCQRHYKSGQAFPSAVAKALRFFPAVCDKDLPFLHIAGVRNRIFIFFNQVCIARRFMTVIFTFFMIRTSAISPFHAPSVLWPTALPARPRRYIDHCRKIPDRRLRSSPLFFSLLPNEYREDGQFTSLQNTMRWRASYPAA